MKKFGEFIKETPTNSSGDGGFSGSASSPVAGYDKTLWSYMVTNAYQSPMDLSYRWSNIFPVKKLSLEDIDDMVDASKEFVNYMNRSTLTKKTFKQFQESKEAKKCLCHQQRHGVAFCLLLGCCCRANPQISAPY